MDMMQRRAFMKGAGIGALAFTVGGAEVLLTPGAARAQSELTWSAALPRYLAALSPLPKGEG